MRRFLLLELCAAAAIPVSVSAAPAAAATSACEAYVSDVTPDTLDALVAKALTPR